MSSPTYQVHPAAASAAAELAAAGGDGTWALTDPDGPCRTWPLAPGCGCLPPNPAVWTELHRLAVEDATTILWSLTAGVFGLCRVTVRPGRHTPCGGADVGWCGCPYTPEIKLPGPVFRDPPGVSAPKYPIEVWIDGAALPATEYRLVEPDRLLRVGCAGWPGCQHLDRPLEPVDGQPDSALGTFGIRYWRGRPVPPGGRRAVALLACELWRACTGDAACRIPARVELVEREGVTYRIIDKQEFLSKGRIGITEIDTWLASVNPRARRGPPAVFSVDDPPLVGERTASTYPGEPGT
jgi:hypothetical protein